MKKALAAGALIWIAAQVGGQTHVDISALIEWEKMELTALAALNLASAEIRLPSGRSQAEDIINIEYVSLVRPHILAIPLDSSDTIGDLINRGELALNLPSSIAASARKIAPVLSTDLTRLSVSYTIDLTAISSRLIMHSRAADLMRPVIPVPAADYTGIIVIASEALPVHGRYGTALAEPCIFPKIWDTDMNLLYERNVLDPVVFEKAALVRYVSEAGIFYPTPSGLSPELTALVGSNPLRIIARGVFGVRPTDPIIDRDDALVILSSEANRRLLREGRVAIVLNETTLRTPFD